MAVHNLHEIASRVTTEAEARERRNARPRMLADERSVVRLTIRADDASALIRAGILFECCGTHSLQLTPLREWDLDDIEKVLVALGRARAS